MLFSHALGIFLVLFLLELTLYVLFVEKRVGKSIGGKEGQKTVYRYSQFLKICITPVHFYERPTFVPGFANRKKSKKKRENSPSICFAAAIVEAAHIPSSERGPTKLLSGNHTQHQAPEVWAVSEHLGSISIYSVYLLASCVLRWLLLHFMLCRLMKGFMGTLSFQTRGILYYPCSMLLWSLFSSDSDICICQCQWDWSSLNSLFFLPRNFSSVSCLMNSSMWVTETFRIHN